MKHLFALLSLVVILSSCGSLTPFTEDLYTDLDLHENTVKKVQFYLSKDLVLFKELGENEASVENGRIRLKEGRRVQEIIIKRNTPGVVVFMPKEDRFAVCFDDDDDKFLMFGPNKKYNSNYTLLGKEWNRQYGTVTYGGEVYQTSSRNALASLLVNVNKMRRTSVKRSTSAGRKVYTSN